MKRASARCVVDDRAVAANLEKQASLLGGIGIPPFAASVRFVGSLRFRVRHKVQCNELPKAFK